MSDHSVAHGTFVVERDLHHPPAKVFAAWADPVKKAKWFGGGAPAQVFDFRPGGHESMTGDIPGGPSFRFDVTYQDIIPDSRILYSYDMHMDGRRISVSLAAVELKKTASGTHLKMTEYGLFLDGLDNMEQRRAGTIPMIDKLVASLDQE